VTEGETRRLIHGLVKQLRELYRSVVTKQEVSNNAKLSVFKSVFVAILFYGN